MQEAESEGHEVGVDRVEIPGPDLGQAEAQEGGSEKEGVESSQSSGSLRTHLVSAISLCVVVGSCQPVIASAET